MPTKERPILFSAPMVRAILEGRKTQTRRIVKSDPGFLNYAEKQCVMDGAWYPTSPSGKIGLVPSVKCPYGVPGDLLWVRETWHPCHRVGTVYHIEYRADESTLSRDAGWDGPTPTIDAAIHGKKWCSSIHMPRWASRLTLRITDVRVERLQSISQADAIAEGMTDDMYAGRKGVTVLLDGTRQETTLHSCSYDTAFAYTWCDIHGLESWKSNPWVWVVEFERVEVSQ